MLHHALRSADCLFGLAACCLALPAAARGGDRDAVLDLDRALQTGAVPAALDAVEALVAQAPAGSTEALVRAYGSQNAWVRRAAVRGLAIVGDRAGLDVLLRALRDDDALVRLDATNVAPRFALAAGAREEVRGALVLRAIDDARPGVRMAAALSLGHLRDGGAAAVLQAVAARDREPRVREAALRALVGVAGPDAFAALVDALELDPDHGPRASAAGLLGELRSEEAVGPLTRALKDVSGAVRVAAARALGGVGTQEAVRALDGTFGLEDKNLHLAVARALGAVGTDLAREALRRALFHPSEAARRGAAESLGYLGDAASLDILARRTEDYDPAVRAAAVVALGGLADARARAVIRKRLGDRVPEVRACAAEAAGRLADTGSIGELVGLTRPVFSDGERVAAAAALGYLGETTVAPVLTGLLDDPSEPVRRAAAAAVGRLGAVSDEGEALGRELLANEASFAGDARVEFLGALAATRTPSAKPFFDGELRRHAEGTSGSFACEVGLYLLGDAARRRVVLEGAVGGRRGANPTLAILSLVLSGDTDAERAATAAIRARSSALRESAALALGLAGPAWAEPLLRQAARDPDRGVALRARVGTRWLELRRVPGGR